MIKVSKRNILNQKNTWPTATLGDLCEIDPSRREISGVDKNTSVSFGMMADLGEHKRSFKPSETKKISEVAKGGYSYFKERDVLLAKMTPCFENGKSGVAENLENGIGFGSTEFYVLRSKGAIIPDWIYHIISSERFLEEGKHSLVGTTGRRRLLKAYVESFRTTVPPPEEQKRITGLFYSIEIVTNRIDSQISNLVALWKKTINKFVSEKPSFGKLLKGKQLKTINFCEAVEKLTRNIDPLTYGVERIVAGENLETDDFKIRSWKVIGAGYLGPAFQVLFKSGDILYGSRRTYLRKVSLADFDGVCANTTYVLRADEEILLQALLKHIMLSERFTQYSIGVSKGSTNPYINWKDLDNFVFKLPDIKTQAEIVNVLDGMIGIIEQLKEYKLTLKKLNRKLLNEVIG